MRTLLLSLILSAAPSFAAATYVSSTQAAACGSGSTAVALQTCSLAVTAGNQLIVSATTWTFSAAPMTISDGGVNAYTLLASGKLTVWLVSSLATTGTVTVTVTPAAPYALSISMEQVAGATGIVDVSRFDDSAITGSSGTYQCTGLTTVTPGAYIYGAGQHSNFNNDTTTMSFTFPSGVNDTQGSGGQTGVGNRLSFGHQITTATVTVAPTYFCSVNCDNSQASCYVVALKPLVTSAVRRRVNQYGF